MPTNKKDKKEDKKEDKKKGKKLELPPTPCAMPPAPPCGPLTTLYCPLIAL